MNSKKKYLFIVLILVSFTCKAQLLFNMNDYRNLVYSSGGYSGGFSNITVGIARREYIRRIKKEVIGIVDISLPVSNQFFTKYFIKKGFQFDLYKNKDLRLPFTFASSSIERQNEFFKYHDITAEFTINPGIYKEKYTLALDCRYELIVFRHIKYSQQYKNDIDSKASNHWTRPLYDILKVGIIGGLNIKKLVVYIKTGYERNPSVTNYIPGYIIVGIAFKCGTKPMKMI